MVEALVLSYKLERHLFPIGNTIPQHTINCFQNNDKILDRFQYDAQLLLYIFIAVIFSIQGI